MLLASGIKYINPRVKGGMRTFLIAVAVAAAPCAAWADFSGRVVRVHDGDTLTLLVGRGHPVFH